MKKLLAAILSAALAMSIVSGCASGGGSSSSGGSSSGGESSETQQTGENVTLSFLSWENESVMQPIIDGFQTEYPNIKIDFQYAPPVGDYIEKLKVLGLTNETPDVFVMVLENREELIDAGTAMDLTDMEFMKSVSALNKQLYSRDGRQYAGAGWAWVGGIFYNKDMFEQAGITEEPKTWDELTEACKKLTDAGFTPIVDNMGDAATTLTSALFASETLTDDPDFDKKVREGELTYADGWTEPFQMWYQGMVEPGYINSSMTGITTEDIQTQFATGQIAMMLNGSWVVPTILDINPELNFKCMGIPGSQEGNEWYFGGGGMGYSINSKTEHPKEAEKFLEYMITSPDALEHWNAGTGQLILSGDEDTRVMQGMDDAEVGLKEGKCWIPMFEWRKYTEALRVQYLACLSDMVNGNMTPEEAAKSMDDKYAEMGG